MKRTALIPLTLSLLALAACANDKPATDASGQTTTTSARYPDGTMSNNVNDTSATGAATNESPNFPSHSNGTASSSGATAPIPANGSTTTAQPTWGTGSNGSRADTAVPAHDVNRSADASSTNGSYSNAGGAPGAQTQPGVTAPPPPQNNSPSVTPVDQGNGSSDLKITQAIRKEVVANSDLSFTAKNVKIITKGGHVTLKGEVKTQKERDAIEGTAVRVAGASNVDDQVVVKP